MSATGKIIKERRKELGISADEIAEKLGVSRSTVFRYENGYIEKVPSNLLETLAGILRTTPSYLMGWSDDPSKAGDSQKSLSSGITGGEAQRPAFRDAFPEHFSEALDVLPLSHLKARTSSASRKILEYLDDLNDVGKREAAKRVEELTHIDRYTRPDAEKTHLQPNAARTRTDIEVTEELCLHDDAIMDDENF